MASNGYLSIPSQHHYSNTSSITNHTGSMSQLGPPHMKSIRAMAIHGARLRSVSVGSPLYGKSLRERQNQEANAYSYAEFCNNSPPQFDLAKLHPRHHDTALAATLTQLDNFLASRNICRNFMLRLCSAPKCGYVHDAIVRVGFMAPLFGDAWGDLKMMPRPGASDTHYPRDSASRSIQTSYGPSPLTPGTNENKFQSDIIFFEPSRTLDVAAGLYVPSSMPAARGHGCASTEMEFEKSELRAKTCSDDPQHPDSSAEYSLPPRPHRRRARRLHMVRDRMSVWGKSAWKRSAMTRHKNIDDSEVPLAQ